MPDVSGWIIDKANITSYIGNSWASSSTTGYTAEDSGTFYIYGPVARVYSYAQKGLLLAVAYTYVSIYAYRNGDWVPIGSCNSIRESDDSGSTSNNWYYNYNSADGTDCVFKVDFSIYCNGLGNRSGRVTVYSGSLSLASDVAYNNYFRGEKMKSVYPHTSTSFSSNFLPTYGSTQGYKYSSTIDGNYSCIESLCTAP